MATLAGNTIASTYPLLLKIDSSGIDGTLRAVQDGDATDSALSIATDSVLVKGDGVKLYFYDADGGEHISSNGSVLSIAGGAEIDLTATDIDINGAANISGALVIGGDVSMTQAGQAILHVNSTGDAAQLKLSALSGGSNYEWSIYSNNAADQFLIVDGSATRLVIDSAGKVGIGTTSPDYILELEHSNTTAVAQNLGQGINIHNTAGLNAISSLTFTGADHNGDGCLTGIYAKHVNVTENSEESELHFVTTASETLVEAMTIDGSGSVGIGTDSPANLIHIDGNLTGNGDVMGLLVESAQGSANSTRMFLGARYNSDENERKAIIKVEKGTTGTIEGDLLLDVANVGIGTASPGRSVQIGLNQSAHQYLRISSATSHEQGLEFAVNGTAVWQMLNTSNDVLAIYDISDSSSAASISPGDNAWGAGSDLRIKKDIVNIDSTLDKINELRPITWKRKYGNLDRTYPGLVAQEVLPHFPLVVGGTEDSFEEITEEVAGGEDIVTSRGGLSIGYNNLVPYLIKAVQELSAKVEALENA